MGIHRVIRGHGSAGVNPYIESLREREGRYMHFRHFHLIDFFIVDEQLANTSGNTFGSPAILDKVEEDMYLAFTKFRRFQLVVNTVIT